MEEIIITDTTTPQPEIELLNLERYFPGENQVILIVRNSVPVMLSRHKEHQKLFLIDKNIRIVIPDGYNLDFPKSYIRAPHYLARNIITYDLDIYPAREKYVVIDEKKLFESKGQEFEIVYRYKMLDREITLLQNYYMSTFQSIERNNEELKEIIGSVYDEDHYDILSYPNRREEIHFMIIIRHDDITITNSIEQSRHIGTIFTYLYGVKKNNNKILIAPYMRGTRLTYSYSDIVSDYTHSHLPSDSSRTFSTFCLGHSNDIFAGLHGNMEIDNGAHFYAVSPLELEGMLIAIQDYLRWESLEGGPHRKMETVTLFGGKLRNDVYDKTRLTTEEYLNLAQREILVNFFLREDILNELKPYFTLVKKGKYYNFTFNPVMLTEKIIELLNTKPLIKKHFTEYSFDPVSKTVVLLDRTGGRRKIDSIVSERKSRLMPSYLNGVIFPAVVEVEEAEQRALEQIIVTAHPAEYIKIANAITRLLNKEIQKNEYRKK